MAGLFQHEVPQQATQASRHPSFEASWVEICSAWRHWAARAKAPSRALMLMWSSAQAWFMNQLTSAWGAPSCRYCGLLLVPNGMIMMTLWWCIPAVRMAPIIWGPMSSMMNEKMGRWTARIGDLLMIFPLVFSYIYHDLPMMISSWVSIPRPKDPGRRILSGQVTNAFQKPPKVMLNMNTIWLFNIAMGNGLPFWKMVDLSMANC